jgi:hypothetical protein
MVLHQNPVPIPLRIHSCCMALGDLIVIDISASHYAFLPVSNYRMPQYHTQHPVLRYSQYTFH